MITVFQRVAHVMAAQRAAQQALSGVSYTESPLGRALSLTADRYGRGLWIFCGVLASAVAHVAAAVMIGMVPLSISDYTVYVAEHTFEFEPEEEVEEILDETEPEFELATPSEEMHENVLSSLAMSTGPIESSEPEILSTVEPNEIVASEVVREEMRQLEAFELDDVVIEKGTVGQQITHVEGAVDRLTHEIAMNLEDHELLVVWLMDASASLVDERQAVADNLARVYQELDQLGTASEDAVLSAVIAFGQEYTPMVEPTNNGDEVVEAIRQVPVDESGVENVFQSVGYTIERYRHQVTRKRRKMMIMLWTDESGDDYNRLEEVIHLSQTYNVPVYTIGPSAMFGRELGTRPYKHPEDGEIYHLPVDRGPDALVQERLRLPYWFRGPQHENLQASLGPFALTRLARESGGAYFIMDHPDEKKSPFELETMLNYLPDYLSPVEYDRKVKASPLRKAVLTAVKVTHEMKFRGSPQLQFEPTGDTFQDDMLEAQKTAAFNMQLLDAALAAFDVKGLDKSYDDEKSKRWQAWYDLTHGRLLAMRARCQEYNWACAEMKGKGREFVEQQSNRWLFEPDEELKFGSSSKRDAEKAVELLTRCVENNRGTPWEMLAQRELQYPLGFQVTERYEPPPPPPTAVAGTPTPTTPQFRPPPGIRSERARQLQRKVKPKLPKL